MSGREADYSPVKVRNAPATPALSHTPSYSELNDSKKYTLFVETIPSKTSLQHSEEKCVC
jgi:hypothetical protein